MAVQFDALSGKLVNNTPASSGGGGSGDVTGPSSVQDSDIAVYDGTTGKVIKDGTAALQTSGDATTLFFYSQQDKGQDIDIETQQAATSSNADGGHMAISGSRADGAGNGGDAILSAGHAVNGGGGTVNIRGGTSDTTTGGNVNLMPGKGGSQDGSVKFKDNRDDNNTVAQVNNSGVKIKDQRSLVFSDDTFQVGFKGPTSYSSNIVWELPPGDGSAGDVLTTDGVGVLSWVSPGGGVDTEIHHIDTVFENTSIPFQAVLERVGHLVTMRVNGQTIADVGSDGLFCQVIPEAFRQANVIEGTFFPISVKTDGVWGNKGLITLQNDGYIYIANEEYDDFTNGTSLQYRDFCISWIAITPVIAP